MSRVLHKEVIQYRMEINMEKFPDWITRKFVEWQAKEGRRKTIEDFAAYLGTSRPLVNMWMNGNKKPGKENTNILAEIFGNEIYDVLDLPRPNPYLQKLNRVWEFLPEEIQKKFSDEAEKYEAQNVTERVHRVSKPRKVTKLK
jgi:transcriptional regulator with XRE-family HTH domain